jgi:hypothetical protein
VFTKALKTTFSQGGRAGEPESGFGTAKVLLPSCALLLIFYDVVAWQPFAFPGSPILEFTIAEFRRLSPTPTRSEFLMPIAEVDRAAVGAQGVWLFGTIAEFANSSVGHPRVFKVSVRAIPFYLVKASVDSSLFLGNFSKVFAKGRNSQGGHRFLGRWIFQISSDVGISKFGFSESECGMRAEGHGLTTHAVLSTPLVGACFRCTCSSKA